MDISHGTGYVLYDLRDKYWKYYVIKYIERVTVVYLCLWNHRMVSGTLTSSTMLLSILGNSPQLLCYIFLFCTK